MTQAQKLASDPSHSVYVSASAGSGKTKVLTDRVLRILLEGTPPGKIMCLTFTNAAAAEMANRINKKLMQWVVTSDAELSANISALTGSKPDNETMELARCLFVDVLDTPDGLKIQTIHSFCQNLMRRFPLEAEIAPHFQVIDEQTSLELLKESRMRLLSNQDGHSDIVRNAISNIAWRVNEGSFTDLLQEITNQREKIEYLLSKYTPEEIIVRVYKLLGVGWQESEYSVISDYYKSFDVSKMRMAYKALKQGGKTDIDRADVIAKFFALLKDIDNLNADSLLSGFADYQIAFLTKEKQEPRKKLATNAVVKSEPAVDNILYQEQENVLALLDKIRSVRIAHLTRDLFHISEAVLALYKKAKNVRAMLDYNDLIIASNRLLHKRDIAPWILYKLDGGIDHLLVDEAQDTSPQQWQVIESLCEEFFAGEGAREKNRTVFIVGDEKQSIFSFQGADPQVFNEMQHVFADRAKNAQKGWLTVALDKSFRSTEPVLRCVDAIFSIDNIKSAVSFLPDYIPHVAHRNDHAGLVELWPLVEKDESEELEPWTLPIKRISSNNPKRKLAENIADTINGWFDSGRKIEAKGRAVRPGDIMILVRSRDELVDYIVAALKARDIAVAGVDRMILTEHIAVMDLIALGQFLLLPQDDLTLATVLKTPLLGISEDDLFELAYGRGKESLWEVLKNSKHIAAYEYLSDLLNKTDFMSPFAIYSYILEALSGRKKFASRLGLEVNDPLDEFLSLALSYEKSHPPSLQGFLNWLELGKTEVKRDSDQGNDEIRIMTVHGSKGLQAPIIFMPDTTSTPSNNSGNIFWAKDDGEPVMLWSAVAANTNNLCKQLKEQQQHIVYNEYLRLLYVALTRAEDELYVVGCSSNANKIADDCWYNVVKRGIETIATKVGDRLVLKSKQTTQISNDNEDEVIEEADITLPDFINDTPPIEPTPSVPLAPSQMSDDDGPVQSPLLSNAVLRGNLVHKLLQYLPDIDKDIRENKAAGFLQKHGAKLNHEEQQEVIRDAFVVINDKAISHIFGPGSKAEVPIAGVVGNYVISGQIDRFLVTENDVLVVDYKTGRKPPKSQEDVHVNYIKQMAAYRAALQNIYPNKKVQCALIWTAEAKFMWLDNDLLDRQAF